MRTTWCLIVLAGTLGLAGCADDGSPDRVASVSTDPETLVVQLSDLPAGWFPVPGESLRVPLSWVLRDPWSAGVRSLIRRQRVAGYERSFWSPERRRVECEAAVYRSVAGARNVFRLRAKHFRAFLAASHMGKEIRVERIGDAVIGYGMERGWRGFTISWRYRRVLSRCGALGLGRSSLRETVMLARLQQRRIARAPG